MTTDQPQLILASSPFLKHREDTPYIMHQVLYSLIPVILAASYFFGIAALLIILTSTIGAMLPEYLLNRSQKQRSVHDGSAAITGVLLGLTLPPTIPLWMAFLGGVVGIVLGKLLFGGIGHNVFNPALVGRAFLQGAFPTALTTWTPNKYSGELLSIADGFWSIPASVLAFPFAKGQVDAVSTATPLGSMKFAATPTGIADLFWGNVSGCLGETCAVLILAGGLYLAINNFLNWRIPVAIFSGVFLCSSVIYQCNPTKYPAPTFADPVLGSHLLEFCLFQALAGGMVLGAVYMATDMVTSPLSNRGCWVFGLGVGIMVIIIRAFGGLPEGVMYAILFMNGMTPLINNYTQPKIYGS